MRTNRLVGIAMVAGISVAGLSPAASAAAAPAAAPTAAPSQATSAASVAPAEQRVWDRLAACESGGKWSLNSGNGYYGGLQIGRKTWISHGGQRFASLPHKATRQQQMVVASSVRDGRSGYGAWPACARKLHLQR